MKTTLLPCPSADAVRSAEESIERLRSAESAIEALRGAEEAVGALRRAENIVDDLVSPAIWDELGRKRKQMRWVDYVPDFDLEPEPML